MQRLDAASTRWFSLRMTAVTRICLAILMLGGSAAAHAAEDLHVWAAGEGTREKPWIGWEAAFDAANTSNRSWVVRPGYYEAPDVSTLLLGGSQLRCEDGAVFRFTRERRQVNAMFAIPANARTVEISGCGFEPNTTVPAVGLSDKTGGRSYIEIGEQDNAGQAEGIRIADNNFGVMRYAGGGWAQGSVWIWSAKNVAISGNVFDAGKNTIATPRGSKSTLYRLDDIVISDNIFQWSMQDGNQGAAIFFGAVPTNGPIKAVFKDVTVSDNQFSNVDGGLYFASGGSGLSITGNTSRNSMDHFFFRENSSLLITDVLIADNVVEALIGSAAIKANDLRHVSVRGNNILTRHNDAAVSVSGSEDVTVSNNRIDRGAVGYSYANCIVVGNSRRVVVTSNQGVDCSTKGIWLFPPLAEIILSDNTFVNGSKDLEYVIYFDRSCKDCSVVEINNQVTGAAAARGFTNNTTLIDSFFARRLWPM